MILEISWKGSFEEIAIEIQYSPEYSQEHALIGYLDCRQIHTGVMINDPYTYIIISRLSWGETRLSRPAKSAQSTPKEKKEEKKRRKKSMFIVINASRVYQSLKAQPQSWSSDE
jgi:hypothetical protein